MAIVTSRANLSGRALGGLHASSSQPLSDLVCGKQSKISARYSARRMCIALKNNCGAMKVSSAISPSMSLYDVLSVPQNVGCAELKKAYRKKVRIYHPDVCPPDEREESCKMFLRVQEAYETLSDPYQRAGYDYLLHSNPVMVSEVRDWSESKAWMEQLQGLRRRSTVSRDTWGGRTRRLREEEGERFS